MALARAMRLYQAYRVSRVSTALERGHRMRKARDTLTDEQRARRKLVEAPLPIGRLYQPKSHGGCSITDAEIDGVKSYRVKASGRKPSLSNYDNAE
jgi:hypothetical protein